MYLESSLEPHKVLRAIAPALLSLFSLVDPEVHSGFCSKVETNTAPLQAVAYPTLQTLPELLRGHWDNANVVN